MRTLIALATLAATLVPASGCVLPGGCGGFQGKNDTVYQLGTSTLIICENGGFVANVSTGVLEGTLEMDTPQMGEGILGTDQSLAFDLTESADGTTATAPQLGAGTWTQMQLNATELDHANDQCLDLVNRSWWPVQ